MRYLSLLLFCCLTLSLKGQRKPVNYVADTSATRLTWTGHAQTGAYSPSGTIGLRSGTLVMQGEKLSAATLTVDMTTLRYEKAELQKHLKDKDFFDVARYPTAIFMLTGIKKDQVTGRLTIKGVTRIVSCGYTLKRTERGLNLEARLIVDRTLFGIKYNSASYFQDLGSYAIKNEFELVLSCRFQLQQAAAVN